jgi:hypothetical protein
MDQPTTLRLNKSITTASNSHPSSVAMYVMSPGNSLRKFPSITRAVRQPLGVHFEVWPFYAQETFRSDLNE